MTSRNLAQHGCAFLLAIYKPIGVRCKKGPPGPSSYKPMNAQILEQRFLEAYDQHADAIFRYCYFRVYRKQEAEELTQDAFMKTWKYLMEDKPIENIRAFLYQVARNLIIDLKRKSHPESSLEDLLAVGFEPKSRGDKDIIALARTHELFEQMEYLQENHREVLMLRFVEGYTPKEIANILNESANVISVTITRAKKALKERYVHPSPTVKNVATH